MPACDPILCKSILNALVFFYKLTPQSIGISIIIVTVLLRLLLAPMLSKSLQNAQLMKDLAPQINKLKKRHKDDKKKFMEAQSQLYKQNGINPAAGCLPQIFQIVALYGFFGALSSMLRSSPEHIQSLLFPVLQDFNPSSIQTHFLYLDLAHPDTFRIPSIPFPIPGAILIAAVLVQFFSS